MALQEYKCPCCGGAIEFNSTLQKMKCPYCDTEFEMESVQDFNEEVSQDTADNMTWDASAGQQWQAGETAGLRTYMCKSCGAEIVGDDTLGSTKCPYCDNPVVMTNQFSGDLKPDFVIPFKVDKAAAKAALKKHCEGKKLLPRVFKDENHIDEIKGVYVPVWLFDADAEAKIRYRAKQIRTWSDANYNYTETKYYAVVRAGRLSFEVVPVDGSTKMDDTLMESIEPFDFSEAVDFKTAYLAGYLADKYDVTAEDSIDRANQRIKRSTVNAFERTVKGYASVETEYSNIQLKNGKAKYVLYPVWMLNTSWNGEKYTFAVNGQTGRLVGDLPVDMNLLNRWRMGIIGGVTAAVLAVTFLMWLL